MLLVTSPSWSDQRSTMVGTQLIKRGIRDARVLEAMRCTPRERFVPEALRDQCYSDKALPVGHGQTISQPYMTAWMLAALAPVGTEHVLEIGTGTGYQAALLSQLVKRVDTVELVPELSHVADLTFRELGYANIHPHVSDGSVGLPAFAPYDAIVVAAAAPDVPQELFAQLKETGKLLIPIGDRRRQMLTLFQKNGRHWMRQPLGPCSFVPLRGSKGWPAA